MSADRGKERLDHLMVRRGLVRSREVARALILAGKVSVPGSRRARPTPGMTIPQDAEIVVEPAPRYVSRGGDKLEHALGALGVDPSGMVALDVGASTGGFTDCLLGSGARRVYAVDVGRGQLAARLRADERVSVLERVNARYPYELPEPVDLAVIDVSFISARLVIPPAAKHLGQRGLVIVLIKPQFEARRSEVGKGGVIRDPATHASVLARFLAWALDNDLRIRGLTASPVLGAKGNREFFCLLEICGPAASDPQNETDDAAR